MRPIEVVLSRLERVRQVAPTQWVASCPTPAHANGDVHPSLGVATGQDERVLITCRAGCETGAVVAAMKLTMPDLFAKPTSLPPEADRPRPRLVRTTAYEIRDLNGSLCAIHRRCDYADGSKAIPWFHPDGRPASKNDPLPGGTTALPLYRSETLSAFRPDDPVIGVEGEKAADALATIWPGPIVATVTGAEGNPGPEALLALRGRPVVWWPDNDGPGRAHAERLARRSVGVAAAVRILEVPGLPAKGDAADYVAAGRTAVEFVELLRGTTPYHSELTPDTAEMPTEPRGPVLVRLIDVTPERVEWAWPGRLALGKVTVLDGDPGTGKSTIALDIAARITTGSSMPDGGPGIGPAGVVVCSAEDGLADTIRPRLEAVGADLARVVSLTIGDVGGERSIAIPDDLGALEAAIINVGAKLVIIDPLMAHLPGSVNSYRDQDVRRALGPLAALGERTGAAILVIRHLTKATGSSPVYRGGGSIGIIGAARTGLLAAPDPDDETGARRVLAVVKSNLAPIAAALTYVIEPAAIESPGGSIVTSRVAWGGLSPHTAAELLELAATPADRSALEEATDVLHEILAAGPILATDVRSEARRAGVSSRTLDRAKAALKVRSYRVGQLGAEGRWFWTLTSKSAINDLRAPLAADDDVRPPAASLTEARLGDGVTVDGIATAEGSTSDAGEILAAAINIFGDDLLEPVGS